MCSSADGRVRSAVSSTLAGVALCGFMIFFGKTRPKDPVSLARGALLPCLFRSFSGQLSNCPYFALIPMTLTHLLMPWFAFTAPPAKFRSIQGHPNERHTLLPQVRLRIHIR